MAVYKHYLPSIGSAPTRYFYVADTEAELPSSGLEIGSLGFALDTKDMYAAITATTWEKQVNVTTAIAASQLAPTAKNTASATVSNNNTTPDNVTDTTVNLLANTNYVFRIAIFFTTAGGCGAKFTVGGTAGVSSMTANVMIVDGTTNAITAIGVITAFDSIVGSALGNGTHYAVIDGAIQTSTAGTLLLKFCQNTSVANPITLLVNTNISTFLLA